MNKYNIKDKERRKKVYAKENYRFVLKSILKNNYFIKCIRLNALLKLTDIDNNSNAVAIRKRCIDSGKSSIASHGFKFSRLFLLTYIRNGLVSGSRKTF